MVGLRPCCRQQSETPLTHSCDEKPRPLPPVRRPKILPRVSAPFLKSDDPHSPAKDEAVIRKYRPAWRALLVAVLGAGALSGCYYDAYTGLWYAYPPYYYPYPVAYSYGPRYPYRYPPGPGPNPAQGYAPGAPPGNAPVQQTPLPPPS